MNELNFCYWLKGFFEIQNPKTLDAKQTQEIKNHLDLVFKKVTPQLNNISVEERILCSNIEPNFSIDSIGASTPPHLKDCITYC